MKLISSDYDGTYDNSLFNIRVNNIKLSEFVASGNIFLLNTGRSYKFAKDATDYYRIPYTYLAVGDGTALYNKRDELVFFNGLDNNIVNDFLAFASNNNLDRVNFLYPDIYSEKLVLNKRLGGLSLGVDYKQYTSTIRLLFAEFKDHHPDYGCVVYKSKDTVYLCVKPKGVNKTVPVISLSYSLSISKNDIFTIGNSDNDIEMIRDFNGFHIGKYPDIARHSLGEYKAVYNLVEDISKAKVKRR